MKKYMFCFLLFAVVSFICLGIGFAITKDSVKPEKAIPGATVETEPVTEDQIVINQEKVKPETEKAKERYYLVSEDGNLIVTYEDKSTIVLYTYMPVTDFPEEERGRLMDGIWFSSMIDVLNYLESYTS